MDLVNRLKLFMETQNIGISQFADSCMIPRPTMSQILNGRNKKISDELITKVHVAYPQLSVSWLMFNEGPMLASENMQFSGAQNAPSATKNANDIAVNQHYSTDDNSSLYDTQEASEKIPDTKSLSGNVGNNVDSRREGQFIDFDSNPSVSEPLFLEKSAVDLPNESSALSDHNVDASGVYEESGVQHGHSTADEIAQSQTHTHADNSGKDASAFIAGASNITINTSPLKKITNIVVFYSDNSFQSFGPA